MLKMYKKFLLLAGGLAACSLINASIAEAGLRSKLKAAAPKIKNSIEKQIQKKHDNKSDKSPASQTTTTNINNTQSNTTPFVKEISYGAGHINWKELTDLNVNGKVEPNSEKRMAHNIYSDPDLSKTSGKFSGFLIDFRADYAPEATYWALCNWSMDTSSLPGKVEGGGAYCGLQHRDLGKDREWAYIMSFWDIKYNDSTGSHKITPKLVYPKAKTEYFGGEGEGSHKVDTYNWKQGQWYKMYLNCYDDPTTGNTIVEQWFQDISTGVWTKTCAFDTLLKHSYIKGALSQFMENYLYDSCTKTRTCEFKNLFVRDLKTGKWQEVTGATLIVDTFWNNKKGSYYFGTHDNTTLVGITNGYGPDKAPMGKDRRQYYNIKTTCSPVTPN